MTDFLNYLFSLAAYWVWLLLAGLVTALIYIRHDSFLLTDLTYRFPIIGKLARFSRDYSETKRGSWLNVEASLCHDYARHVTALSKADFERNTEYLRLAYDHGRKPMPAGVLGIIIGLVILEGIGFSYLLGSWMVIESSENLRLALTVAIVLVIAAILVWVTHSAGHQLYRTRLLRSCFQLFQASTMRPDAKADDPKVFSTAIIAVSQNQSEDDDQPAHVRCANRVITRPDDVGSYAWVWLAIFLVTVIAIISVVLRMETLHSSDLLANQLMPAQYRNGSGPGANPLTSTAREHAALASFAILSTIFIVTQMVGMGVGYWYGFAGKQSHGAYRATRGCPDYDTYFAPVRRRMSIADLRLTTLHRLMERRLTHEINWSRDFLDFIREERGRGATDLQDPTAIDTGTRRSPARRANGASQPVDPTIAATPNRRRDKGDRRRADRTGR
jgi:hypothetical protein